MKKVLLLLLSIIFILFFIGCMNNQDSDKGENDNTSEIYFNMYYSTESERDENITVSIFRGDVEVYNKTINVTRGSVIFNYKSNVEKYIVKVTWSNINSTVEYTPNGFNTLILVIKDKTIQFSEVSV